MSSAFPDVKPFPGSVPAPMGHNRPPLDEMIVAEFMEGLQAEPGLMKRVTDLIARATDVPGCDNAESAGRYGDFVKMCRAAWTRIEEERERHNRPILTAQRALKGRADSYVDALKAAAAKVQASLDAYMNEQCRIANEKRRQADEQARVAREAAEAERQRQIDERVAAGKTEFPEVDEEPLPAMPLIDIEPARIEEPVVRGDYGSRVGSKTVWRWKVLGVRKLPDAILNHEKVLAAIDQVIGSQVRGGTRSIKGVEIWDEKTTVVR